jgi:hypothetical protein
MDAKLRAALKAHFKVTWLDELPESEVAPYVEPYNALHAHLYHLETDNEKWLSCCSHQFIEK